MSEPQKGLFKPVMVHPGLLVIIRPLKSTFFSGLAEQLNVPVCFSSGNG